MTGNEDNYNVRFADFKMAQRDIAELRKDYWGNGKDGTKIEIIKMKKDFDNYKKVITAKINFNSLMTTLVLAALIGNLIRSFF